MALTQTELDGLTTLAVREGVQAVINAILEQQQKARELAAFQTIGALTTLTVSDFTALATAINDPATQSLTVDRCIKGVNNALAAGNANRLGTWALCLVASVKGKGNL